MKKTAGIIFILLIIVLAFNYRKIYCHFKTKNFPHTQKTYRLMPALYTADGKVIAKSEILYRLGVYKNADDNVFDALKKRGFKKCVHYGNYCLFKKEFNASVVKNLKNSLAKLNKKYEKGCIYYGTFEFVKWREKRVYPYGKLFTPIVGVTKIKTNKPFILLKGYTGLQGAMDEKHNVSTLGLKSQKEIFEYVNNLKKYSGASLIIGILVNKKSGEILADASSNFYNPSNLTPADVKKAVVYENYLLFSNAKFLKDAGVSDLSIFEFNRTVRLPFTKKEKGKFNFLQLIRFDLSLDTGCLIFPHYFKNEKTDHKKIFKNADKLHFPYVVNTEKMKFEFEKQTRRQDILYIMKVFDEN